MKVEIYSDVACPWCFIGERRLARALTAFPGGDAVEVVFRPYQLDPGAPAVAAPLLPHLDRRFGGDAAGKLAHVTAAGAEDGIAFDWDRALAVNTLTAHRVLALAAREHGPAVQRALLDRIFDAYFSRGADVSDHALLARLAAESGMDEARVRAYLDAGEGAADLARELAEARALGVRAVPTFVFDDAYVVQGAQPASVFLQVLEEVRRRSTGPAAVGDADADACADDACAVPTRG